MSPLEVGIFLTAPGALGVGEGGRTPAATAALGVHSRLKSSFTEGALTR